MDPQTMLEELNEKEAELRSDLLDLEKQFNSKKEQYLKIQGAIEALTLVGEEPESIMDFESTPEE
tara:strand:- start:48 stop:242 length:195 start_codon:yes stop_codon:yes gene_type:complete